MKKSHYSTDAAYKPYTFRGLRGRYVHWPSLSADARRTFVVAYGQHSTLERLYPIAAALREFGDVYVVDTPGFGGMEPSFKIGEYPSLHFLADHTKHFIDTHVPADRQLSLLGISFGFQILTQTLADYPELCKRVEQVFSFVGFVSHTDFSLPFFYRIAMVNIGANLSRSYTGAKIFSAVVNPTTLRVILFFNKPFNPTLKDFSREESKYYIEQQLWLWEVNDDHTHGATAWDFTKRNDLRNLRIDAEVLHIGVPNDHLINNKRVVSGLKHMYSTARMFDLNLKNHAPLDIDTPEKVSALLPSEILPIVRKSRNKTAVTKETKV